MWAESQRQLHASWFTQEDIIEKRSYIRGIIARLACQENPVPSQPDEEEDLPDARPAVSTSSAASGEKDAKDESLLSPPLCITPEGTSVSNGAANTKGNGVGKSDESGDEETQLPDGKFSQESDLPSSFELSQPSTTPPPREIDEDGSSGYDEPDPTDSCKKRKTWECERDPLLELLDKRKKAKSESPLEVLVPCSQFQDQDIWSDRSKEDAEERVEGTSSDDVRRHWEDDGSAASSRSLISLSEGPTIMADAPYEDGCLFEDHYPEVLPFPSLLLYS